MTLNKYKYKYSFYNGVANPVLRGMGWDWTSKIEAIFDSVFC